jgi:diazepam-binding inhibitor (GABA receptor modulator, acyl-CoA-binding protein)
VISEAEFLDASERVKNLPSKPDNDTLLELYGLFKQATEGDVHGAKPGMFDFVGRAKYDAWEERAGMSQDEARAAYVALVAKLEANA